MGRLDVRIVKVTNAPNTEMVGKPDLYCTISVENQHHKTRVLDNVDPRCATWNELFKFTVADPESAQIKIKLFNKNLISDDACGSYRLGVSGFTRGIVDTPQFLLMDCPTTSAEMYLRVLAHDFGVPPTQQQIDAAVAAAQQPQNAQYNPAYQKPQQRPQPQPHHGQYGYRGQQGYYHQQYACANNAAIPRPVNSAPPPKFRVAPAQQQQQQHGGGGGGGGGGWNYPKPVAPAGSPGPYTNPYAAAPASGSYNPAPSQNNFRSQYPRPAAAAAAPTPFAGYAAMHGPNGSSYGAPPKAYGAPPPQFSTGYPYKK